MPDKIRILLLDDHSLFRESLSRLLSAEPGLEVAGSCATVAAALGVLESEPVDVVLLDFDLGGPWGFDFLREAKQRGFAGRTLLVTAGSGDLGSLRPFEEGCSGIVLKHSPPGELVQAIQRVAAGEMWLDPRMVRTVVNEASARRTATAEPATLTRREADVLKSVFDGLANKEIAGKLGISESAVKASLQHLFAKTGAKTRSQLVRIALERHAQDWLT